MAFDAVCKGSQVDITWATASERDNAFFTVERSFDSADYQAVAVIEGMGNSITMQHYAWVDGPLASGLCYYRLKQTDLNGSFMYSDVVPVQCGSVQDFDIFPNPANDSFSFIAPPDAGDAPLTVELRGITGQLIQKTIYVKPNAGGSHTDVSLNDVSEGIYFVTFIQQGGNRTYKLTVLK